MLKHRSADHVSLTHSLRGYALLEVPPGSSEYRPATYLYVLAVGVVVFSAIRLILETLQAIKNTRQYLG